VYKIWISKISNIYVYVECLVDITKILCFTSKYHMVYQARNQGGSRVGKSTHRKFFAPLEKCVGHILKLLDIV